MRKITFLLLFPIVAFCLGAVCGAYWFNHRKVFDKEGFSTICQERDFLLEANRPKYELIWNYDRLLEAIAVKNDPTLVHYYSGKIDSLYNVK